MGKREGADQSPVLSSLTSPMSSVHFPFVLPTLLLILFKLSVLSSLSLSLPLINLLIDQSIPHTSLLSCCLHFIVPGNIRREVMMNGAALGQTATTSCQDIYIFLSYSSLCEETLVGHKQGFSSILINCARHLCENHCNIYSQATTPHLFLYNFATIPSRKQNSSPKCMDHLLLWRDCSYFLSVIPKAPSCLHICSLIY